MIIRNFYNNKLAQASYLIGCAKTGEAIVIDPMRDIAPCLEMAKSQGLRITAVTETHIHADYVSGTRQLSAVAGATMYLSGEGGPDWQYGFANDPLAVILRDGDLIHIGNVSLKAIHTPGHTPEHLAFLLTDHPVSSSPHSLFAGDFVFVGDVGRPDLLEKAAGVQGTMELGARDMYRSIKKLGDLSDSLLLWPGHGSGSSCGKSLGGSPVTTLGYERSTNWALLAATIDGFVEEILAGQPDPPYYFAEMKRINRDGPPILPAVQKLARKTSVEGQLIDIRDFDEIRAQCFDDAIAVPYCNSFPTWAGWMIRYDSPVTLISDSQSSADNAVRDLESIGLDDVAGWVHPSDLGSSKSSAIPVVDGSAISEDALVLDVRVLREREENQVQGSIHIPFGRLQSRLSELPRDRRIVVHCQAGGRSPIAYSVLRKAGFEHIEELAVGMAGIQTHWPELLVTATPVSE